MKTPLFVLTSVWLAGFVARADESAGPERIGDYLFSMDGKPFKPKILYLYGEPGRPAPGDLILLFSWPVWMYVPLGKEREWRLEEVKEEPRGFHLLELRRENEDLAGWPGGVVARGAQGASGSIHRGVERPDCTGGRSPRRGRGVDPYPRT